MRAVMRGDRAKKPFRPHKRFFLSKLFLSKKRKSFGPAQRPRPLGWKEIQRKRNVFSFSHSFFFLQKKEWEKKEKRHPRSLRFVSQRRLRRNLRRLASQRRLPGGDPAAGGASPAPTKRSKGWNMNAGEMLAPPGLKNRRVEDPADPGRETCKLDPFVRGFSKQDKMTRKYSAYSRIIQ